MLERTLAEILSVKIHIVKRVVSAHTIVVNIVVLHDTLMRLAEYIHSNASIQAKFLIWYVPFFPFTSIAHPE